MRLAGPSARLVDAATGTETAGSNLGEQVARVATALSDAPEGLVSIGMPTSIDSVVRYLGAWEAARPIALLDPDLAAEDLAAHVARYEPSAVLGMGAAVGNATPPRGYRAGDHRVLGPFWWRHEPSGHRPHPDLGVLLATSGSTGDPKFVRLARSAILANTTAIIEALGIGPDDVAISTLPFHYSFGLSVLNTHLRVGASIIVEAGGLVHRGFWTTVEAHEVTTLSLVPSQFAMLDRLRFDPARHRTLRTLTQAGGRLQPEVVLDFHRRMARVGGRLFVMYGQTEAGPRMTTLPPDRLVEKIGSVGPALSGGCLSVRDTEGRETTTPRETGEVLYRGPNVMMGYAEQAADLSLGDVNGSLLETGDLGHLDEDGYLYIDGRLRRFGKVFGVRLNLDDLEAMLSRPGRVAAVAGDDQVIVWIDGATPSELESCRAELARRTRLHWSGFDLRTTDAMPMLANGKVDYRALERES